MEKTMYFNAFTYLVIFMCIEPFAED